jgi:hypothetical protein
MMKIFQMLENIQKRAALHQSSIHDAGASGTAFPRWSVGTIDILQRTKLPPNKLPLGMLTP